MKKIPERYRRKISKDEINELPLERYAGEIRIVRSEEELADAIDRLRDEDVLGFDTETRPTFRKGKINLPSLVQLACSDVVYLFQLNWLPFGEALASVLSDADIVKTGVAVRDDIRDLQKLFAFNDAGVVDLGEVAQPCRQLSGSAHLQGCPVFQLEQPRTGPPAGAVRRHRCLGQPRDTPAHAQAGAHRPLAGQAVLPLAGQSACPVSPSCRLPSPHFPRAPCMAWWRAFRFFASSPFRRRCHTVVTNMRHVWLRHGGMPRKFLSPWQCRRKMSHPCNGATTHPSPATHIFSGRKAPRSTT